MKTRDSSVRDYGISVCSESESTMIDLLGPTLSTTSNRESKTG